MCRCQGLCFVSENAKKGWPAATHTNTCCTGCTKHFFHLNTAGHLHKLLKHIFQFAANGRQIPILHRSEHTQLVRIMGLAIGVKQAVGLAGIHAKVRLCQYNVTRRHRL